MRVLIACDKFKGSLSALEACEAIRRGLGEGTEAGLCPIADGGEGFVDAMVTALGGVKVHAPTHDPLGRPIQGSYGLIHVQGVPTAVIEMAEASGMWRLKPEERNPRIMSTYGTGELMRHAVEVSGAKKLLVGLGGSATNDGGAGMAAALGVRFLDVMGAELQPVPAELEWLAVVDEGGRIALPEILVACDVDHPLLGERGASAVFGPQKGASPEDVVFLDGVLGGLVAVSGGENEEITPGAGAAGGLGFGLLRFAGARLVSGFDLVAGALGLRERLVEVDLVITGEGSLDEQTLGGKGPAGVARMAREAGKPVVAFAGRTLPVAAPFFDAMFDLAAYGLPLEESMRRGGELLETRAREAADLIRSLAGA
ncbi:glycerate kinase [Luteolibacter ambystomatis]|uniref:Glycerate kinase n=1 Tax=Luteolibacter ambystomatis TaxID=2824561 RepID=A0A975PGS3_9BACT|nr:glycerate kinase [Luteolibacter ambystomatis]QUE52870.1 glycerate kinase [Luteolibacter ambystomatis]